MGTGSGGSGRSSGGGSGRRTNLALAVLLVTAVVSGLASQAIGVDWPLDLAVVHGAVALGILLLVPWKSTIVRRGLSRRRRGRVFSLILLTVVLTYIHAHMRQCETTLRFCADANRTPRVKISKVLSLLPSSTAMIS